MNITNKLFNKLKTKRSFSFWCFQNKALDLRPFLFSASTNNFVSGIY